MRSLPESLARDFSQAILDSDLKLQTFIAGDQPLDLLAARVQGFYADIDRRLRSREYSRTTRLAPYLLHWSCAKQIHLLSGQVLVL